MSVRYRNFLLHASLAAGLFSAGGGVAMLRYRAWEDLPGALRDVRTAIWDDGAARAEAIRVRLAADSAATAGAADEAPVALHAATRAFYAARAWAPAWTDEAARDTLAWLLADAANDALPAERYHAGRLAALPSETDATSPARATREVLLTDGFFRLAEDQEGRVAFDSLYGRHWVGVRRRLDPAALLTEALAAEDPAAAIARAVERLRPPHPEYAALRAAYARRVAAVGAVAGDSVLTPLALNMERWRWLPDDLGDLHVFVNIPSYRLWVRERAAGAASPADVLTMRVVVGLPGRWRTPVMTDTLGEIVFNPSWTIPPSIQRESYGRVNPRGMTQGPGPRNPLGRAKFLFPNPHAVYIHDTTAKWAFERERRAYSHGCVRAAAPDSLAAALLTRTNTGWTAERVAAIWEGPWRTEPVRVERTLPVHLVYFTAVPAPDGEVAFLEDVYDLDARLTAALAEADAAPPEPGTALAAAR